MGKTSRIMSSSSMTILTLARLQDMANDKASLADRMFMEFEQAVLTAATAAQTIYESLFYVVGGSIVYGYEETHYLYALPNGGSFQITLDVDGTTATGSLSSTASGSEVLSANGISVTFYFDKNILERN